jgi:hypothetical protein
MKHPPLRAIRSGERNKLTQPRERGHASGEMKAAAKCSASASPAEGTRMHATRAHPPNTVLKARNELVIGRSDSKQVACEERKVEGYVQLCLYLSRPFLEKGGRKVKKKSSPKQ